MAVLLEEIMERRINWQERLIGEKRKIVLWGTGKHAKSAFPYLVKESQNMYHIDFVIDGHYSSETMRWMDLPVRRPEQVEDWTELFIIVAVNNVYWEIKAQLDKLGLRENYDYVNWQEIDRKYVLGISALYHDSAAALLDNGEIIAAAQEERFTRQRYDLRFPENAIRYCMREAGITFSDLDAVVYYDNPLLTADRLLHNIQAAGDRDMELTEQNLKTLLIGKLWIHHKLRNMSGGRIKRDKIYVCEHHISHAASAFYASPFEEAAILTFDGVGEWATTTIGVGSRNGLRLLKQMDYPHSLGLLYSAFTLFCGFKVNSGEYKLMELALYGQPVYYEKIRQELITIHEDGSYELHLEYFSFYLGENITNDRFAELFDGGPRDAKSRITRREADLAASIQKVMEEVILKTARYAKTLTGMNNLCVAGEIALNSVANGRLLREKIFDRIWIQPAAGDAGGALGGAYFLYYGYWDRLRRVCAGDAMKGAYLGPAYSDEQIKGFLEEIGAIYFDYQDREEEFYKVVAEYLAEGRVIGLFQGRMEFGPRALGNRSIIAKPHPNETRSKLSFKINFRESFRHFFPSVLAECCEEYFDLKCESPYMLLEARVEEELCSHGTEFGEREADDLDLPGLFNKSRSSIPIVTHLDYSTRVQTVTERQNYDFYHIIKAFKEKTGCGYVVNTSFNLREEPIVCSPRDAWLCFQKTDMDVLILGKCILIKEAQEEFYEEGVGRDICVLD